MTQYPPRPPQRPVGETRRARIAEAKAEIAVVATELGLPVGDLLTLVRQVGQIKCPFCELAVQVLAQIKRVGRDKAVDILKRVIIAKQGNDYASLAKLIEEFNGNS